MPVFLRLAFVLELRSVVILDGFRSTVGQIKRLQFESAGGADFVIDLGVDGAAALAAYLVIVGEGAWAEIA